MGRFSRDKGARVEREMVDRHKAIGVHAARVPLSGAAGGRFSGDVDVHAFGADAAPLVSEVKARANGAGFTTLERWLGDNDLVFLRRDRADPLVVLPWRTYERLVVGGGHGR
ncbi:MAG: hypothetical protein ISP41_15585 [Alphaproteobacteria bacterium]|nr:hypothetical protein [Alphaproteobacteria bacterium]